MGYFLLEAIKLFESQMIHSSTVFLWRFSEVRELSLIMTWVEVIFRG